MVEETLFELPDPQAPKPEGLTSPQQARVLRPVRNQVEWVARDLDASLPEDHPARAIWAFLDRLDLSPFYASIKSVLGRAGHPTTDPQVLLALWLFATSDGVGSARQIARLCKEHDAYRWICGGVPTNYHTLSDFRVAHQEALDGLLTEILASMMDAGLVRLHHVAQDGMRVRASAGASSFRREATLQRCLAEAEQQVAALAAEREQADPGRSARQEAARERAAQERQQRVETALRRMPKIQAAKERSKRTESKAKRKKVSEARVSTTDPEARVMKMPDGGFRPAYNLQLATDEDSQVIVGVAVDTTGNDGGQAPPARGVPDGWQLCQARGRYGVGASRRDGLCPHPIAEDHDQWTDESRPTARRNAGGGAVAEAHGNGGGQGDLQGACCHVRMRECPRSTSQSDPVVGARHEKRPECASSGGHHP